MYINGKDKNLMIRKPLALLTIIKELLVILSCEPKHIDEAIFSFTCKTKLGKYVLENRSAIFLMTELIAGPYRSKINAADDRSTKTIHQAEIDSACELIDFLRFNVEYVTKYILINLKVTVILGIELNIDL